MAVVLNNRVIAITGAASGIGRALALQCAREGAKLALVDRSEDALRETVIACESLGVEVLSQTLDVSERDAVYAWADRVAEHFGRAHMVINNAGVNLGASVEATSQDNFDWVMDVDFWGVVHGTRAFLPHLRAADWGHVVNVSSLFGLISMPNQSAYNAAKFAVRGFSESLRMELLAENSHVGLSCVHPGGVKTNIVNSARFGEQVASEMSDEERKHKFNNELARTTPEQAARIILNGVKKNRGRILVGGDARLFDLLQRLLPSRYQNIAVKMFAS